MMPIETRLREAWYKFRDYVNTEMDMLLKMHNAGSTVRVRSLTFYVGGIREQSKWPTD
jgi:hypothetical protein